MAEVMVAVDIESMTIIEKIVLACDRRGISQARLEQLTGLAKGRISKWSGGTGTPTADQCGRIAEVLRVPLVWLIDDRAGGEPPSLSDDELVLRVYHALGLTVDEAIRGLNLAKSRVDPPAISGDGPSPSETTHYLPSPSRGRKQSS